MKYSHVDTIPDVSSGVLDALCLADDIMTILIILFVNFGSSLLSLEWDDARVCNRLVITSTALSITVVNVN